jgi:DNA-binding SARP family transcriptional activator
MSASPGGLPEPARTRLRLCGGLALEIDGRRLEAVVRGRQARLLFAYLAVHRERPVRRDELIAALWPEAPPASPDDALNTLVWRLRKALGEGVISGRSQLTLSLPPDATIDVESAFEQIQRAERELQRSDWHTAASAAEVARSVAERGFLPEVEAGWVDEERDRLEELRLRALECLAACGLGLGGARLSATERAARALIAAAPYRETGYCYLMQAHAARGRVAEALRVFDGFRRLLQEELGAPPGAALRSLHERLLSQQGPVPANEERDPLGVWVR